jgi:hypothetical protein
MLMVATRWRNAGWPGEEEAPVSSAEENKALARRFLEAQAKGDLETLDELMAPNFVDRSVLPGQGSTREDYKQSVIEKGAGPKQAVGSCPRERECVCVCRGGLYVALLATSL